MRIVAVILLIVCGWSPRLVAGETTPAPREAIIEQAIALARQAKLTEDHAAYERVLALLAQVDTAISTDHRIPYWQGVALRHLGRSSEAIAAYARADQLKPNDTWILLDWGCSLSALGRLDEAACLFCRSVECDGNNLWAYCDAASTLISLGRDEEGLRYAEAAAALSPTDEEARIALGSALLHLKQYDRAVFHLQAAAELFPSDPLVREHLAYALAAAGRNEEAVTQCEKAVALAPSNVNYRVELRDLFDRLGRTPKALVQAQRAVDLAPACDPYRFDLACLLDQIGNNSDALPHLRQLAVTSSTNLDYRQELTWCQWSLQRYDEALENAQFLVKADPHKAIYWSLRGCALDSKRRLWASQASFQKACELDPATERYRLLWQNERKRCVIADTAIGGLFLSTVLLLLEFIRWWTGKTACQVARGKLN